MTALKIAALSFMEYVLAVHLVNRVAEDMADTVFEIDFRYAEHKAQHRLETVAKFS